MRQNLKGIQQAQMTYWTIDFKNNIIKKPVKIGFFMQLRVNLNQLFLYGTNWS